MAKFKEKLRGFLRGENASSLALTIVVIAVAVILNVLIYLLDVNYGLYLYAPENDGYTVSDSASEAFSAAAARGDKVTILFCRPEDEVKTHTTGSYVYDTAKQLAAKYPDLITLDYANIITGRRADGSEIDLSEFRGQIDRNSVIFLSGGRSKAVTDFTTTAGYSDFYVLDSSGSAVAYKGEETMTAMTLWVLTDDHPKAYLTTGHGQQLDREFFSMLTNAGYETETLDLRKSEVPADAGLVLICTPISDFEAAVEGSSIRSEIARLTDYLERGGNLYVSLDPYGKRLPTLEAFLARYGIEVSRGEDRSAEILRDSRNAVTTDGYTFVTDVSGDSETGRQIRELLGKYDTGSPVIGSAASLLCTGGASPLLVTSPSGETYASGERTGSAGVYTAAAISSVAGTGESLGKTGRLFAVCSASFSNADALTAAGYANKDLLYAVFDRLYGSMTPPYGTAVLSVDSSTLENLTMGAARTYTAILMLIPLALAIVGAVLTLRRKNR